MATPKISVLIICYNQEKLISRAIDSLLSQKEFIHEICVSDDASTDNTWEVLLQYQRLHPGLLKLHRQNSNTGIFENVEQVWSMPTGNLMYRLAGDDMCGERWFESVIRLIEKEQLDCDNEAFCVYGDYRAIYPNSDSFILSNRRVLLHKDAVGLSMRKMICSRSVCFSKGVWKRLMNVSEGRSYAAETAQDIQLQVWSDKNYYIPQVGNIYYTGLGVSVKAVRTEKPVEKSTPMELVKKVLDKASHRLSPSDQRLFDFYNLRAHRRMRKQSGKKVTLTENIVGYLRMKTLYVSSINLTCIPLYIKRISFAIMRRLPHTTPLEWRID